MKNGFVLKGAKEGGAAMFKIESVTMRLLGILLCSLSVVSLARSATAQTTYSYTSNPFNSFSGGYACPPECKINGSFTLAAPLAPSLSTAAISPTSFSFTDGNLVWTNQNASPLFPNSSPFVVSTDTNGDITAWDILLLLYVPAGDFSIYTQNLGGTVEDHTREQSPGGAQAGCCVVAQAVILNNPGTWTCSYNVVSTDNAGNFGFAAPVLNPGPNALPNINSASVNQTIPLQITVTDCHGNPATNLALTPPGTVVLTAANTNVCAVDNPDNSISTGSAGNSGWQNLGSGIYQYNWKPQPPKGACLSFSVNLGDCVQHIAYFQFKE